MLYTLVGYRVQWDLKTHKGQIEVQYIDPHMLPDRNKVWSYLYPETPEEMSMLVDLLRNEKPVQYDPDTSRLWLAEWETIGEGES